MVKPWRKGRATGEPQVLVNYVRRCAAPGAFKAFLDYDGHAAINTYLTVRPKAGGPPIEFLWAVLNSPSAMPMPYCHTMQKHIYDGLIAKLATAATWGAHVGQWWRQSAHTSKW